MGCNGSRRACRDADGISVRLKTTKVVENCLKSTLVAEIGRIKVPKKGNLRPLRLELSHFAFRFGAINLTISAALHAHLTKRAANSDVELAAEAA